MRIWGGMADDFRVAGAELEGEGVRLALVSIEDPRFTGSAFVSTRYGIMTEYVTPARTFPSTTLEGFRTNAPVLPPRPCRRSAHR